MPADMEKPRNYHTYIFYAAAAMFIVLTCIILCYYKKIRTAIKIMQTAADFVTEVCTVMLVPPVCMILIIIWALVWLYLMAHVYARGTIRSKVNTSTTSKDKNLFYGEVELTSSQFYECWVFLFGYLWINAFIGAANQFIIASAACIWYFSPRDPNNQGDKLVSKAVSRSVWRCLINHLGTIAMGSFFLATV